MKFDILSFAMGMKAGKGGSGSSGENSGNTEEWIGDGNTHIWITLPEGRTSPMLGVCPNGTVTVDWGDGTEPDVLTGTSVLSSPKHTPTHKYAKAGDYMITLTVDGEMSFYGTSGTYTGTYLLMYTRMTSFINMAYSNAIRKIEIGNNTSIGNGAFCICSRLSSITIPESVTSIGNNAFANCVDLNSIVIPESVTSIDSSAFAGCKKLRSITIPESVTHISNNMFSNCYELGSITVPKSVTSIGSHAFSSCYTVLFYDFTNATSVPTLSNTNAFMGMPEDCEIRVPTALYDEWIAATNWATYASHIVAV